MKSGVVASSGSVSAAGTNATVNAAGNTSIAGIVMTIAALARTVLDRMVQVVPAPTATIVIKKTPGKPGVVSFPDALQPECLPHQQVEIQRNHQHNNQSPGILHQARVNQLLPHQLAIAGKGK